MTQDRNLDPTLRDLMDQMRFAKEAVKIYLESLQSSCEHLVVYHTAWKRLDWFPSLPATRICACCRKEEAAEGFSETFPTMGGQNMGPEGRMVLIVERDKLYSLRVRA